MNKTITITLGGQIFYIEEDAYQKLNNYLEIIRQHFQDTGDSSDEIVADIELGLSDIYKEKISEAKQALNLKDIEEGMTRMGTLEDLIDNDPEKKSTTTKPNETLLDKTTAPKRLYRNPDDQIIAGVCSGLGAFFGWDPIIFRLIFVGLIFSGGFGILLYIIFWIATPEAKTTSQKITMTGQTVTLASLENQLKVGVDKIKSKNYSGLSKVLAAPFRILAQLFQGIFGLLKKLVPVTRVFIGIVISIMAIALFTAATAVFASLAFKAWVPYFDSTIISSITTYIYYILTISLYFILAIPAIHLGLLGLGIIRKKLNITFLTWGTLLGLWILSVIIFSVISIKVTPQVETKIIALQKAEEVISEKKINLTDFDKLFIDGQFTVNLKQGPEFSATVLTHQKALDLIKIEQDKNTVKIKRVYAPENCLFYCPSDKKIIVEVVTPKIKEINLDGFVVINSNKITTDILTIKATSDTGANLNLDTKKLFLDLKFNAKFDILSGSTDYLEANLNEYSHLGATKFVAKEAIVKMDNSSNAEINVLEKLKVTSESTWEENNHLYYIGQPKEKNIPENIKNQVSAFSSETDLNNKLEYRESSYEPSSERRRRNTEILNNFNDDIIFEEQKNITTPSIPTLNITPKLSK